jgi:hypothetical protein
MSRSSKSRTEIIANLDWRLRELTTSAVLAANAIARKVGMGPNDLKCGEILVRRGPMSAGELAEMAGLTTGAITGIVDRLEKAGWGSRPSENKTYKVDYWVFTGRTCARRAPWLWQPLPGDPSARRSFRARREVYLRSWRCHRPQSRRRPRSLWMAC